MESSRTTKNNLQRACYGPREHFYGIDFLRTPVKMPLSPILDFYRRLANLSPGEVVAKTKQCCKLHCYARYQAYCYVPPQTLMKVSCESGRGIRAEIQTFRLSPKFARAPLHDSNFTVSQ